MTIFRRLLPLLMFCLLSPLFASSSFITNYNESISQKSIVKIDEIVSEIKQKSGISIYFDVINSLNGKKIDEYTKLLSQTLPKSHIVIVVSISDNKIDLNTDVDFINKNRVLDDFIIPILVSQNREDAHNRYSAALLNGMVEIADEISSNKNIKIESNLSSDSYNVIQLLRIIFWLMVLATIIVIIKMKYFGNK
jgi:hypothetical protein